MTGRQVGWREPILKHFTEELAAATTLTLVSDPDRLFSDQALVDELQESGFEVVQFEDPVAFRYTYEDRYRWQWEDGGGRALAVLTTSSNPDALPYDLVSRTRKSRRLLRFSISEIFPSLSPQVLENIDRSRFDELVRAVREYGPSRLGDTATRDFVLRHLFDFAPELIKAPRDLLRFLLLRHYRNQPLPGALDERIVASLKEAGHFQDWPLEKLVPDRDLFFAFLEERWPIFVERHLGEASEGRPVAGSTGTLSLPGPELIPFDDEDVRVYIDNLFLEGHLTPTDAVSKADVEGSWVSVGVRGTAAATDEERFARLTETLRAEVPEETSDYRDWIRFAARWAEWNALRLDSSGNPSEEADELWSTVQATFLDWMGQHYGSLHSLAYHPHPAMVHHLIQYIAHGADGDPKIALIVLDGLAWSQWIPLKKSLGRAVDRSYTVEESGAFAWVPTITPVSRQSIFSGEPPLLFAETIQTTAKDEGHWRRFWQDRGLKGHQVQFVEPRWKEADAAFLKRITEAADHPRCRALGGVIPTVDEMTHGAVTGGSGLHAQVGHWAEEGHFRQIVEALVERDFAVFITSDHGSVECMGIGKPNVGELAEERGSRVHVFTDDAVRERVQQEYPGTLPWPSTGLPKSYKPLLTLGRRAFVTEGRRTVSHGGATLEETVVPFVTVEPVE